MTQEPDRNLALELVRVTEAAALAAARWVGFGEKIAADQAAVDAMRYMLGNGGTMKGTVVIGEGEKDEAPMLYNGEQIGTGTGVEVDVAVDPWRGRIWLPAASPTPWPWWPLAEKGQHVRPRPGVLHGEARLWRRHREEIDLRAPIEETLELVAAAKRGRVRDLMVVILDRPRHDEMVKRIRAAGARIRFIPHGDVAGAMMAASPDTGIDLLWGIGGTPEGVLAAAAFKCLGGQFQGRLWPRDEAERAAAVEAGYDPPGCSTIDDLVRGDNVFFAATGVTTAIFCRECGTARGARAPSRW